MLGGVVRAGLHVDMLYEAVHSAGVDSFAAAQLSSTTTTETTLHSGMSYRARP